MRAGTQWLLRPWHGKPEVEYFWYLKSLEQDFLLEQTPGLLGQVMAGPVGTAPTGTAPTALVTAGNST